MNTQASIVFIFVEGLLAFISPCILPMLPVYIVYLMGNDETNTSRKRLLVNTLGFIAGFTLVFVILGAAATSIGSLLRQHRDLLTRISGWIMVVFGLFYMGILRIPFLDRDTRIQYTPTAPGFCKSLIFGAAFSFGWTSCTGANLGAALLLASHSETILAGMGLLVVYSLGLGLPFLITALLYEQLSGALNWLKKHHKGVRIVSGLLLILTGLALIFNVFGYYQGLFY